MKKKGHGIALFSGGLDSALAILMILQQNVEVTALSFMNHFGCDITDKSSCSKDPYPAAEKFGFKVKMVHLGHKFVDIVRNPKHGHGKNMNPCIDCRILMLREAKTFMELVGADFVFTGEVVGQRPMSQHKPQLNLIKRESGLGDKLVRPLSAKLLPETEPEHLGILDRGQLGDINGRSRKVQMELAEKYGLEDYPGPAAGCLLTDPSYSKRLRDYFSHQELVDFNELNLLRVGRHFRIDENIKIIVGRDEEENGKIEKYRKPNDWIFEARDTGSPITLVKGPISDEIINAAAAITARYCRDRNKRSIKISYWTNEENLKIIDVEPTSDEYLKKIRI
ncbi:MAG: hypothetical protein V3V99_03470 [candidate division Zixibacteria bacterium]